jgi:hypothetical protein
MIAFLIVILSIAANPLIQPFIDTAKETVRVMSAITILSDTCTQKLFNRAI